MMFRYVVDACALIAYLFDEEGSALFEELLLEARKDDVEIVMHFVNLGEVYYDVLKRNDMSIAKQTYHEIKLLPIRFENRISDEMVYKIGDVKTNFRISYADAFAAAQSILLSAELVTTDHKEFGPLEKAGLVKIMWLR